MLASRPEGQPPHKIGSAAASASVASNEERPSFDPKAKFKGAPRIERRGRYIKPIREVFTLTF